MTATIATQAQHTFGCFFTLLTSKDAHASSAFFRRRTTQAPTAGPPLPKVGETRRLAPLSQEAASRARNRATYPCSSA